MAKAIEAVVAKDCPNSVFMWFEVSKQVNQGEEKTFARPTRRIKGIPYVESVGELGNKIARDILKITGVVQLSIAPNKITVEKLPYFRWESLAPKILEIISQCISEESSPRAVGQEVADAIT